jgi:hypothetical protein
MTDPNNTIPAQGPSVKTAVEKTVRPQKNVLTWWAVLRGLQGDDVRSAAMGQYRAKGYTAEDFATKRNARVAMCAALTAAEDWLENEHPGRRGERAELRAVRRKLERELWP